jgi:hypothetical protein
MKKPGDEQNDNKNSQAADGKPPAKKKMTLKEMFQLNPYQLKPTIDDSDDELGQKSRSRFSRKPNEGDINNTKGLPDYEQAKKSQNKMIEEPLPLGKPGPADLKRKQPDNPKKAPPVTRAQNRVSKDQSFAVQINSIPDGSDPYHESAQVVYKKIRTNSKGVPPVNKIPEKAKPISRKNRATSKKEKNEPKDAKNKPSPKPKPRAKSEGKKREANDPKKAPKGMGNVGLMQEEKYSIPKRPFGIIVKDVVDTEEYGVKFSVAALDLLHNTSETLLRDMFERGKV